MPRVMYGEKNIATIDTRKTFPIHRLGFGRPTGSPYYQNVTFYLRSEGCDPKQIEAGETGTVVRMSYTEDNHQLTLDVSRYPTEDTRKDGIDYLSSNTRDYKRVNPAPFNATFTLWPGKGNDDERNKLRTQELVEALCDYLWFHDEVWANLNIAKPTTRAEIMNACAGCPIKRWPLKKLSNGQPAPGTEWRYDQKLQFAEKNNREAALIYNCTKSIPQSFQYLPPDQIKKSMWLGEIYYRYTNLWIRKSIDKQRGTEAFLWGVVPYVDQMNVFDDTSSGLEFV